MRFNLKSIAALAVMSVFAVQFAEAWTIQFQDSSASTPEFSEKLTTLSDNTCCCSGHHTKTETGAAGTHLVAFAGELPGVMEEVQAVLRPPYPFDLI
ncbi:hypothetical protein N7540_007419 [Penicillium herquei]|nr:hypothetical protein N7540_007419 [Penicillium herquei]